MKIAGKSETVEVLAPGDSLTVGVTHQIKVGGEDSWVKYEVHTLVREGETTEAAETRVLGHVNAAAMKTVMSTVEKIREVSK